MKNEIIEILEKKNAIKKGHFILSCGKHSEYFIGISEITSDPKLLNRLTDQLIDKINPEGIDIVASAALSGIFFGGLIALKLNKKYIYAEQVGEEMVLRRGFDKLITNNTKVLIADDVITSGLTIKKMESEIKRLGGIVVSHATLWEREDTSNLAAPIYSLVKCNYESWEEDKCKLCKRSFPVSLHSNKRGTEFLEKHGNDPKHWPANK